jgi:hypothetical protein
MSSRHEGRHDEQDDAGLRGLRVPHLQHPLQTMRAEAAAALSAAELMRSIEGMIAYSLTAAYAEEARRADDAKFERAGEVLTAEELKALSVGEGLSFPLRS